MSDGVLCRLGCGRVAVHKHHRKRRSQGGTNDPVNLIDVCLECHEWIHRNPEQAYELGLLVHSWDKPDTVEITIVGGLEPVSLARLQNESKQLTVDGDEVPHKHVVNEDGTEEPCPRCKGKGRVLKRSKPLAGEDTGPKEKAVWAIRVPKEHRENGAEVLDGLMTGAAEKLAEGGHDKGWTYRTLVMVLSWFLLNYEPSEDA